MEEKISTSHLLGALNREQVCAVTHGEGPLLIVAGAGTGKTTVLTRRIAWLIEQGLARPEQILALTFTEKAAAEMEERVDLLLPYGYVDLQISTFHSFCERILREYGAEIGLSQSFLLADELDAWLLARQNFDRFELDHYRPMGNPTKYLRALLWHFSRAKDELITPEAYLAHAEQFRSDTDTAQAGEEAGMEAKRIQELARAYHTYQQILREHDALDFGDLVMEAVHLVERRPRVLSALRERYRFLLVDEFQDTNWAQYELIKRIAAPQNNLTVVGDDDQAIYKFRGASLSNILQFEEDYPKSARVVLVQNYRSGQEILDVAHRFIQHNNPNRLEGRPRPDGTTLDKKLRSGKEDPGQVELLHYSTVEDEAQGVVTKIRELRGRYPEVSWNDFGILVRANGSADPFVEALEVAEIPYQFLALRGLYSKPVVLDILACLRAVENPYHSQSLYRLFSHPRQSMSAHDVATLAHEAHRRGKNLYDLCREVGGALIRPSESPPVSEAAAGIIREIFSVLQELGEESKRKGAAEMVLHAAERFGILAYVNTLSEGKKREDFTFLRQLYERVKRFEERQRRAGKDTHLRAFLDEFEQEREAGEEGSLCADPEAGPEFVRIMTVHGAKGLEFRFVFVVNMVDKRFPTIERRDPIELPSTLVKEHLSGGDPHLEEERRLFYVAVTRAKDRLFLTSAEDYGGARKKKPSRFLLEAGFGPLFSSPSAEKADPLGSLLVARNGSGFKSETETPIFLLPKQMSFTQLRAFETCPLQYKFAHLLRIPIFGSKTKSYGSSIHRALEVWFKQWIERTGKHQGALFYDAESSVETEKETCPVSLDELLVAFEAQWIDEWYADDRERESYHKKGRAALRDYGAFLLSNPIKPLAVEQEFTIRIGEIVLKGRMDRVDEAEDGGVEIIDYKTTEHPKETLGSDDKEQLLLYQLAAEEILRRPVRRLTYYYLENQTAAHFLGTPDDLAIFKERLKETVSVLRTSTFLPTPGRACRFCDFRDICEYRSLD